MAKILIIDDDLKICKSLSDILGRLGHQPAAVYTLKDGLNNASNQSYDVILLDLELPDGNGLEILPDLARSHSNPEIIIITGTGNAKGAKLAFKHGAWDFVQKPFTVDEVSLPIVRALEYRKEKKGVGPPVSLIRGGIIGTSNAIQNCLDEVAKASSTTASVLITGETGTGKELFARAIHENSARASGNFIAINCGAIPESLAEETFFGHEKGVFTGAHSKKDGIIRQADGGTLFLDEIGDLTPSIQQSLLRALQERSVRPLGGEEQPVDFRLVAATNCDLEKDVKEKRFRADLLYRIRAIELNLPPLRNRVKDIQEIAVQKHHQICKRYGTGVKGLSPEFMAILNAYDWPGNVRELINTLEFSLASAGSDPTLYPKHLPPECRLASLDIENDQELKQSQLHENTIDSSGKFPTLREYRDQNERHYFDLLIKKAKGNREKACTLSGVSQARLYTIMKKYNFSLFKTASASQNDQQ